MERPELLTYRIAIDLTKESPVFGMTGCPHRLGVLADSDVITTAELAELAEVFATMIQQILQDENPAEYPFIRQHGLELTGEEQWVWQGTVQRIARKLSLLALEVESRLKDELLPTHVHGDGTCEMCEIGGKSHCKKQSRQEEIDHRQLVVRGRQEDADPERIENQLVMLEEFGLIERLKSGGGLKAGLNLNLKGKVDERNEGKKGKVKGGGEGLRLPPSQRRPTGHLSDEVKAILQAANTDPDLVRFVDAWPGYSKVLNNPFSGNPADAPRLLAKMMAKEGADERFAQWLRKHPAPTK